MPARRSRARIRALVLLPSLLLAGCFQSEQPKFPLTSAAAPFGRGGNYVVYEHVDGGEWRRQEVFAVTQRPDGAYDLRNEAGKRQMISLYSIGDEMFAGQAHPPSGALGYGYMIFRISGDEAVLYLPQCERQDANALMAAGVEIKGRLECHIDGVADPLALLRTLAPGPPVSKLVRQ